MYDGKQNPSIARGDNEPLESYLGRMRETLQQLEWRSDGHRFWYTHKNPHGCWICDLVFANEQFRGILESLLQTDNTGSSTDSTSDNGLMEPYASSETHELEDK